MLKNKTVIITGSSRGIGKAIALRFAEEGANIVAAAKSLDGHPKLPGSLKETVADVKKLGAKAIAVRVDVRHSDQVNNLVQQAVDAFGSIDILVNNAGAISLTNVENTSLKIYDRMHYVNDRAVFLCSQAVIPYLKKSENPHILNLSPPINLNLKWFKDYSPYTASKYSMSMLTLGLAEELKKYNIAVNSLWPKTIIATAAIEFAVGNKDMFNVCRTTQIMADAAFEIVKTTGCALSGQLLVDEEILRQRGYDNLEKYAFNNENSLNLYPDLFIDK